MNLPYWTIFLVPPLLLLAYVLARGPFGRGHGHHQAAAVPARHFPGRRPRQAEDIEAARRVAWVARVTIHEPSPLLARQMEVAALTAAIPCWKPCPPAAGPVPDAMQDDDPRYPHLDRPWADSTGTFSKIIEGEL